MGKKRKAPPCSHCQRLPGDAHVLVEYIEGGETHQEKLETGWCWTCFGLANLTANLIMAGLMFQDRNDYLANQKRFYPCPR